MAARACRGGLRRRGRRRRAGTRGSPAPGSCDRTAASSAAHGPRSSITTAMLRPTVQHRRRDRIAQPGRRALGVIGTARSWGSGGATAGGADVGARARRRGAAVDGGGRVGGRTPVDAARSALRPSRARRPAPAPAASWRSARAAPAISASCGTDRPAPSPVAEAAWRASVSQHQARANGVVAVPKARPRPAGCAARAP